MEKLPANFGCKGTRECDGAVKVSLTAAATPKRVGVSHARRIRAMQSWQNPFISTGPQHALSASVTLRPRRHLDVRVVLDHISRMYGLNHIYGICREIIR
jgi:hypothetical protein